MEGIREVEFGDDQSLLNVIEVDVKRSFNADKNYDKESLLWLLRVGTENMKGGAGYCQGMNYIAGALLYQGLSRREALELYLLLIEQRMEVLFDDRLSYLNLYFFTVDRLLSIFLEDLSNDFSVAL